MDKVGRGSARDRERTQNGKMLKNEVIPQRQKDEKITEMGNNISIKAMSSL